MPTRAPVFVLLAALVAAPAGAEVHVRWLGVAGFAVEAGSDTILHDPYFSRPGFWRTMFRPYVPDAAVSNVPDAPGWIAARVPAYSVIFGHGLFGHGSVTAGHGWPSSG